MAATETNGNYINPIFVGWATGYTLYSPSDALGTTGTGTTGTMGTAFADPNKALGPVTASNFDIVSLGDMSAAEIAAYQANPLTAQGPGALVLTFNLPITNGAGADFATFENGFVSNYTTGEGSTKGNMFAELGFVEVSTNGVDYARFPTQYLNPSPTGSTAYLTQDVSNIYNMVGKHANAYSASWGTPFDLDDLLDHPFVMGGLVNLSQINFVKIVDIPGNGTFKDSDGRGIYDAWVTWGSGGLDFEALGVINAVPEPSTSMLFAIGAAAWLGSRRRK